MTCSDDKPSANELVRDPHRVRCSTLTDVVSNGLFYV